MRRRRSARCSSWMARASASGSLEAATRSTAHMRLTAVGRRRSDARDRFVARALVRHGRMQQRHPVRPENADTRRAAHGEAPDRRFEFVDRARAFVPHFVRQQPLIQVDDGVAVPPHGLHTSQLHADRDLRGEARPAVDRSIAARAKR